MYQELVIDVNISANAIMDVLYMVLIIAINVGKAFLKPRNIQNGSLEQMAVVMLGERSIV